MILGATTAFGTTEPPTNGILPYTDPVPYCIFLVAISFTIACLVIGTSATFIIHRAKAEWFNEVRYPSILCSQGDTRRTVYYRLSNPTSLIQADVHQTDDDGFAISYLGDDDFVIVPALGDCNCVVYHSDW